MNTRIADDTTRTPLKGSNTMTRVIAALEQSGYTGNEFTSCKFVGLNDRGNEMHRVTFQDEYSGDGIGTGTVYLERKADGKLYGEF